MVFLLAHTAPLCYNGGRKVVLLLTDTEFKICLAVRRYHTLGRILAATGYKSFDDLQDQFPYNALDFDGFDPNVETVICLTRRAEEEYSAHKRSSLKELRDWITLFIAIYGAVTATIGLVVR